MQQSYLSTGTLNSNNINDGTVASRMLHSLINEYDNNNTASIPPSPRESAQFDYKSKLIVIKHQQQFQQQQRHNSQSQKRLQLEEMINPKEEQNNVTKNNENDNNNNLQSYRSNMSIQSESQLVELMVKRESQLKQLENFIMKEIQEINQSKERNLRIKERIIGVKDWIGAIKEEYCNNKKRICYQIDSMRDYFKDTFEHMVVTLITEHKQSTQSYIQQIDSLRQELQKKDKIISKQNHQINEKEFKLCNYQQQKQEWQKQKQLIHKKQVKQSMEKKEQKDEQHCYKKQQQDHQQEKNKFEERQRYSQVRNRSFERQQQKRQQSNYTEDRYQEQQQHQTTIMSQQQQQCSSNLQHTDQNQHHLQVSFSVDNRQHQLVSTILVSQQTSNNNKNRDEMLVRVETFGQEEKMGRENTNSDKQLTGGFGAISNQNYNINHHNNKNRVRFEVETSSIQQRSGQQQQLPNQYHTLQQDNNNRQYQKSLNHSQSQHSPRQHQSFIQSSQVQRMNTMSFSINHGNDQLSTINQLDVFSDNGFGQHNLIHNNNQQRMSEYEQQQYPQNERQKERNSVVRSQGGLYSFKKNNNHYHHQRLMSENICDDGQSVVEIKVDSDHDMASRQETSTNNINNTMNLKSKQQIQSGHKEMVNDSPDSTSKNLPTTNNKSMKNSSIVPKLSNISSPSVINLQLVPQQPIPSTVTQRKKSPHRYDYCRLYEQQQLREIQNLNQMCNNILIAGSRRIQTKENDLITIGNVRVEKQNINTLKSSYDDIKSLSAKEDDIIKKRLSMLKKDVYPSFGDKVILNSNSKMMSASSHSNLRKNLTIEIPQSPNLHHNPAQNPYYKVQNHLHQMSVQEFSPQRQRHGDRMVRGHSIINKGVSKQTINYRNNYDNLLLDTNYIGGVNVSNNNRNNNNTNYHQYNQQQTLSLSFTQNNNQPYKQTTQSIKDRKQYIRTKIENIKRKNISNNVYKDGQNNIKNQYKGGRSPRVISFLKSQQQQNTASRMQLQRASVVNRSVMMTSVNNNRSIGDDHSPNQKQNESYSNSRHIDYNIKIRERLQQNQIQKGSNFNNSNTKGYDFTQDKLQKQLKQRQKSYKKLQLNINKSNISNKNNHKNSILEQSKQSQNDQRSFNRSKQSSYILTKQFSQQNNDDQIIRNENFVNDGNDIYSQLNHYRNERQNDQERQFVVGKSSSKTVLHNKRREQKQTERKSPLKRSSSPYNPSSGVSSSTMSPLKVSTRNNNSLYLQPQLSSSTKKNSMISVYNNNDEKYSQQNVYRHPYVINDKRINTSINSSSNVKINSRQNGEEDNFRRYDPTKGVAGFRRF